MFHGKELAAFRQRQAMWLVYREQLGPRSAPISLIDQWVEAMELMIVESDRLSADIAGRALVQVTDGRNVRRQTILQAVIILQECWEYGWLVVAWARTMGMSPLHP